MDKKELTQIVKDMIAAPSCCQELKDAGKKWLDAVDTDAEKAAAAALLLEVRDDVSTVGHALEFFESPLATQIFGAEQAKAMAEHFHGLKAKGEKWCDCPACAACLKIIDNASLLA